MLSILDCSPGSRPAVGSRRELLRVGGLAFGGLSLPGLLGNRPVTHAAPEPGLATSFGRAKSVIVMFLGGGPPQHESWDPKPEAPPEIRGGFGSIDSATPGLRVGELMPLTATLTDQIAVLRRGSLPHARRVGRAHVRRVRHAPVGGLAENLCALGSRSFARRATNLPATRSPPPGTYCRSSAAPAQRTETGTPLARLPRSNPLQTP